MKEITKSDVSDTGKAVAALIVLFITALPVLLPLAVRLAAPTASQRWLGSLNATISRHHRAVIVAVEVVFGVYLLAKGLSDTRNCGSRTWKARAREVRAGVWTLLG